VKPSPLDAYLNDLQRELAKHGLADRRVLEEVREHLLDSVRSGVERGLTIGSAEYEALSNFGPPALIAAAFVEERNRMNNRLFLVLKRMAGVLRGGHAVPARGSAVGHFHDVGGPSSFHFALRLKRRWRKRFAAMSTAEREQWIAEMRQRGEDTAALESDPRERLVLFLQDFARRTFDSGQTLESLTLLEDTTDAAKRGGRYLAAFTGGTRMVWTVALTADGSVSFDGMSAPA
jgi:hypothetical protein